MYRSNISTANSDVRNVRDKGDVKSLKQSAVEQPILFDTLVEHLDENQKDAVRVEYQQLGNSVL